jgi:hypothetical protein
VNAPSDPVKLTNPITSTQPIGEDNSLNFLTILLWTLVFLLATLLLLDGLHIKYPIPFESELVEIVVELEEPVFLRIGVVGDIMTHDPQLIAQTLEDGTFDFRDNYRWMRPLFSRTQIMIGNLETTLSGADRKFTGYPMFNSPDALAAALSDAYFNVIITANNHMYDRGGAGMIRTLEQLRAHGLSPVGTRIDSTGEAFIIKAAEGIKVGITAFSYESQRRTDYKFINGIRVRNEHRDWMNTFDPTQPELALKEISAVVDQMRAQGAELTIVALHWGSEYKELPNNFQQSLAKGLHQKGVDIILGSHPHVVQPVEWLKDSLTGHQTVVAYSFGNFISNQRFESNQKYPTEDGLYLELLIERPKSTERPRILNAYYEPTWVHRYLEGERYRYEVLPTSFVLEGTISLPQMSSAILSRVRQSFERTSSKIKHPAWMDSSEVITGGIRPYSWRN